MISEDYVSFETAKLLKEKGFDADITTYRDYFIQNGNIVIPLQECIGKDKIKTPTLQLTMKWLREIHQLHIGILVAYNYFPRRYRYHIMHTENVETYSQNDFDTYEQACEVAIKYCLENLI